MTLKIIYLIIAIFIVKLSARGFADEPLKNFTIYNERKLSNSSSSDVVVEKPSNHTDTDSKLLNNTTGPDSKRTKSKDRKVKDETIYLDSNVSILRFLLNSLFNKRRRKRSIGYGMLFDSFALPKKILKHLEDENETSKNDNANKQHFGDEKLKNDTVNKPHFGNETLKNDTVNSGTSLSNSSSSNVVAPVETPLNYTSPTVKPSKSKNKKISVNIESIFLNSEGSILKWLINSLFNKRRRKRSLSNGMISDSFGQPKKRSYQQNKKYKIKRKHKRLPFYNKPNTESDDWLKADSYVDSSTLHFSLKSHVITEPALEIKPSLLPPKTFNEPCADNSHIPSPIFSALHVDNGLRYITVFFEPDKPSPAPIFLPETVECVTIGRSGDICNIVHCLPTSNSMSNNINQITTT